MKALVEEGITCFEISLSDEKMGLECIRLALEAFKQQDQVMIGAGTVMTKEQVDQLVQWKIPFMLTPGFDPNLISYALELGIEVLPGVLTPSEVQKALNQGIHLMKLFPANAFSVQYIKALKGPFPQSDFIAVGGVSPETTRKYLNAGFKGVAVGGNLVPKHATRQQIPAICETAKKYLEAIYV